MRLCVGIGIGLALGVALMLLVSDGDPQVVSAQRKPSGNGDVNGDGKINVADAVYILGYLFAKGPAPEAIECASCCPPVCPPERLPATGQKECYEYDPEQDQWGLVPCERAVLAGQDGAYQAGCPMAGRFTDNGDGTVTDNCTGLMWQKDTADVNGDGTIRGEWDGGDAVTWEGALEYCENLEFAGHSDWRLPNVGELQSIVDYGRWGPSIDLVFGAVSSWYWSSSTAVHFPHGAWLVSFDGGGVGGVASGGPKDDRRIVRAVRR